MSLQLLAKQMEAKGRGGDSVLVHMTPGEVEGLQKLAEAAGGTLTVNPETGLVEANFLKKLISSPAFAPLLGAGLMLTPGGMPLAIAGGALAGGLQAKENDQDFFKGALMGGLGAYGGASLSSGLMAAGAPATAAAPAGVSTAVTPTASAAVNPALTTTAAPGSSILNPATAGNITLQSAQPAAQAATTATTAPATFSSNASQAAQGIAKLGTKEGAAAFGKEFGLKQAMAGAAPMLMPGERPPEEAPDDEMYSYTYNPGRTGAERTPSGSSAERLYFDGGYSPVRKIRASQYPLHAAQGGLMSYAEGGETVADATTIADAPSASELALAYLMGERSSSSAGLPAMAAQAPVVGADNLYAFNPATGEFLRNPEAPGASSSAVSSRVGTSFSSSNPYSSMDSEWNAKTDDEKAAYFRANPTEAAIAQFGQKALYAVPYMGTVFAAQDAVDPMFRQQQRDIVQGGRGPSYDGVGGGYEGSINNSMSQSRMLSAQTEGMKKGGLLGLAKGGMASGGFVVPADVVSALGNGSTDAGLRKLSVMMGDVKPIKGKGDGLSDSIPTNIDGKQAARVADGEAYIDPKTVKRVGGAKKLYAMMDKVRAQAHGKTSQQRKVNPAKVMA